jgi:transcriptional regulator with XRE-family HTH domain
MNQILKVLKEKGITQTWLSKRADKSYTTINEYARNKRQPSLEDLYKIAELLDVSITQLIVDNKKQNG